MPPKRKAVRAPPQAAAVPLPATAPELPMPIPMPEFTASIVALEQALPPPFDHAVPVSDAVPAAFALAPAPVAFAYACVPAPASASKPIGVSELYHRDREAGVLPLWSSIQPAMLSSEMNVFLEATKKYPAPRWTSCENLALLDSGLEACDLKAKNHLGTLVSLIRDNYARNLHLAVSRDAWEDPWAHKHTNTHRTWTRRGDGDTGRQGGR